MKKAAIFISMAMLGSAAQADGLVGALGRSDLSLEDTRATGIAELSYRFGDAHLPVRPQATLSTFDAGYVFAGAGAVAQHAFSSPWFVEASGQVGVLNGPGDFGTQPAAYIALGIGRSFGNGTSMSLGASQILSDGERLSAATLRLHFEM